MTPPQSESKSFAQFFKNNISIPALVQGLLLGLLAFVLTNVFLPVEEFEAKDFLFPVAVFTYVYVKNGTSMADLPTKKKLEDKEKEEDNKPDRTMRAPRLGPRSVKYVRGLSPGRDTSVVVLFVWQTSCKHCAKSFGPIIDTTKGEWLG